MPWTDGSPLQNVPSTPLLGHARQTADTPVALVPENIGCFDSPGYEDRVPSTPIASITNSSPSTCRPFCENLTTTPDICTACSRKRTPNLSYRRRNVSRDLCFSTPTIKQKESILAAKEQVVPGTPCTPLALTENSSKQNSNTPTPVQTNLTRRRPQRILSPPPPVSKQKATINLFKGDDIFG